MELYDYQRRAVTFGKEVRRVYFAADMGVGKTAITLTIIKELGLKAIVYGPLKVIQNTWPSEIKKWAPELTYAVIHGPSRVFSLMYDPDIVLINYDGLKWLSQQSGRWTKRIPVFDEASMVKSHSTLRHKLLIKMRPLWHDYMFMLSGTPAPNSLMDLWAQYKLLDGGKRLGVNISEFRRRYCSSISFPGVAVPVYSIVPGREKEIMEAIAPITFRLKAEDYLQLPDYVYNEIPCTLPAKIMDQYKQLERDFILELEEQVIEASSTATLGLKLRQFLQGCVYDENRAVVKVHTEKLDMLVDIVRASTTPILCAINFRSELQMIREALPGTPFIAGGSKDSQSIIEAWNRREIPLLLCNPASMAHGVNLQDGGYTMLWYCLTWNLEHYMQFNARLRRLGQTAKNVFVNQLIVPGTIDEVISKRLIKKESVQDGLLEFLRQWR